MHSAARSSPLPWLVLVSRLVIFAGVQALLAGLFFLLGSPDPWSESGRWWVFTAILANTLSVLILVRAYRAEGSRYADLLRLQRSTQWPDLGISLGVFLLAAPIGALPGIALGRALFGDPDVPVAMMFRPLPLWAVAIGLLFPTTIAFAELPTYFGYAMPRLEQRLGSTWAALALAALFLSLQHLTLPLLLDWRFVVWRAFMFLPFALFLGLVLRLRSRLLPYLMVSHFLVDLLALSTYLSGT